MDKYAYEGYIRPGRVFGEIYFVGVRKASTHVIKTEEGLIVIDPGMPDTMEIVFDNMRELGLDPRDTKWILLSHGHYDHAGGVKAFKAISDCKVYIGEGDLAMVRGDEDTALSKDPNYRNLYSFEPDGLLKEEEPLSFGGIHLRCLATPGHSAGTMSLFFEIPFEGKLYLAGMHGGVGLNTLSKEFLEKNHLPLSTRDIFRKGLMRAAEEPVEIFLGNHIGNNDTIGKLERVRAGEKMAFYAPAEWKAFLKNTAEGLNELERKEDKMEKTIERILEHQIITIVRGVAKEKLIPLAEAMYAGGIRLMECTFNSKGETPDEEVADNIQMLAEHFGERMLIGSGTVLTERQVELTAKAGGKFIISPNFDPAIVKKTKKCNLVSIPGIFTPSEAVAAVQAGADFVKLFPMGALGPKYLKDLTVPLSHIRFLAVGGVNAENLKDHRDAGACGYGIASEIVHKPSIEKGDFEAITQRALKLTSQL